MFKFAKADSNYATIVSAEQGMRMQPTTLAELNSKTVTLPIPLPITKIVSKKVII